MPPERIMLHPDNAIAINVPSSLEERNRLAREAIKQTAIDHAKWDMAVGAAGIFGFALPALIVARATQGLFFHGSLAEKPARIYTLSLTGRPELLFLKNILVGGAADLAGEFTTEF